MGQAIYPNSTNAMQATRPIHNGTGEYMCKWHIKGECTKGALCMLAHTGSELLQMIEKPNIKCKYFLKNQCAKGDSCIYTHPTPDVFEMFDPLPYMCKWSLLNECT